MLPLIAVLLPVMLVFLGFAVDVAYMQNTRLELHAVTDAAARAAASTLSRTDSKKLARDAAERIADSNRIAGQPLKLAVSQIEFGRSVRSESGKYEFSVNTQPYNAVRVTGDRREGSDTGAVPLLFGKIIGAKKFEPVFTSTASFLNVDICLVLDRSTSMKADVNATTSGMYTTDPLFCQPPKPNTRWRALDGASKVFTDALRDSNASEQVAIVSYNSAFSPAVYCGTSTDAASLNIDLTTDLDAVDGSVTDLTGSVWNGNTDIESGMRKGLNTLLASASARPNADRIMIVMTDGNENVGSAVAAASDCRTARVQVHTVTFSVEANQTVMKEVASIGGGKHLHAETEAQLKAAFKELAAIASQLTD
ncbi:von Willebrand factor type A domain protein [Posidoniimonas polymericola]|uniref:von Willebrand factor type A domain protein n=1 Tax=Posidoniimonas polymericola TaxID=2528002 RepID=A0A5C5ZEP9_9BACT|nr:vWA domain-containing protein [Posidoniimonas polymericola]TWT85610.1 von Willebrand factor type A domain protein [Posidoniimonas polymericola]